METEVETKAETKTETDESEPSTDNIDNISSNLVKIRNNKRLSKFKAMKSSEGVILALKTYVPVLEIDAKTTDDMFDDNIDSDSDDDGEDANGGNKKEHQKIGRSAQSTIANMKVVNRYCRVYCESLELGGFSLEMIKVIELDAEEQQMIRLQMKQRKPQANTVDDKESNFRKSNASILSNQTSTARQQASSKVSSHVNLDLPIVSEEQNTNPSTSTTSTAATAATSTAVVSNNNKVKKLSEVTNSMSHEDKPKTKVNETVQLRRAAAAGDEKSVASQDSARSSALGYKMAMEQLRRMFLSQNAVGLSPSMWWLRAAFIATIVLVGVFAVATTVVSIDEINLYKADGMMFKLYCVDFDFLKIIKCLINLLYINLKQK